MNKIILMLCLVTVSGCVMEGKPVYTKQIFSCVDTRDNEKFVFKSVDIKSGTIGTFGADSCITVIDSIGIMRTLCKSHEQYIKCVSN